MWVEALLDYYIPEGLALDPSANGGIPTPPPHGPPSWQFLSRLTLSISNVVCDELIHVICINDYDRTIGP